MSSYRNVTEQDFINLAEQQKNQRAYKIQNKILKQTHDRDFAEAFTPVTRKLEEVFKKIYSQDEKTQTPTLSSLQVSQIKFGTQSLRDTLTLMKRSIFLN